jgi:hypothetical protein
MRSTILYCTKIKTHRETEEYWHFYPNMGCVEMCGPEKIYKVNVIEDPAGTYWGWWSLEEKTPAFIFVYPAEILLNMCFPYGPQAETDRGRGFKMSVRIEMIEEIPKEKW